MIMPKNMLMKGYIISIILTKFSEPPYVIASNIANITPRNIKSTYGRLLIRKILINNGDNTTKHI